MANPNERVQDPLSKLSIEPKAKIGVIFYSTYGHVQTLAEEIIKAVEATGATAVPYQIAETLDESILSKMYAGGSLKPKYPVIKPEDLKALDGFLFGFPTRYGRAPAQVDAFFDATGGLWATGGLVGKFAGIFTSTASQHGGQETTILTTLPFLAHQGIIFVPIGFVNQKLADNSTVIGGSAWGAATVANGDGSRQPSADELSIAEYQGTSFAKLVSAYVRGRDAPTRKAAQLAAQQEQHQLQQQSHQTTTTTQMSGYQLPQLNLGAPLGAPVTTDNTKEIKESKEGYEVPSSNTTNTITGNELNEKSIDAPTPTSAPVATPAPAPAPAAVATPAPAPAVTAAAPVATSTPAVSAAKPKQQKKAKAGFFASCCGKGDAIE